MTVHVSSMSSITKPCKPSIMNIHKSHDTVTRTHSNNTVRVVTRRQFHNLAAPIIGYCNYKPINNCSRYVEDVGVFNE